MPKTVQISTEVYCTLQVEGLHNWPGCPFPEVNYLKDPHRGIFHIKAYKKVNDADRDVEFIMLKHEIDFYLRDKYYAPDYQLCDFGSQSCEMIARELISKFNLSRCEVSEDGENGAVVSVGQVILEYELHDGNKTSMPF